MFFSLPFAHFVYTKKGKVIQIFIQNVRVLREGERTTGTTPNIPIQHSKKLEFYNTFKNEYTPSCYLELTSKLN